MYNASAVVGRDEVFRDDAPPALAAGRHGYQVEGPLVALTDQLASPVLSFDDDVVSEDGLHARLCQHDPFTIMLDLDVRELRMHGEAHVGGQCPGRRRPNQE